MIPLNLKSPGLILLLWVFSLSQALCQEQTPGYILDIRDNKIYLDFTSANIVIGDKLQVITEGGYFTHPVTGEKIKEDDETIAVLEVTDVRSNYSIAEVYPEEAISKLQKGTKVYKLSDSEQNTIPQTGIFKKSIAVQPLTVLNIQGYLGIYIGDVLTEQLLKDDSFRVLDRQSLGIQTDQMVLSSGGVLSEAELLQYSSRKGADYYITGTMYEPDVVELSTGVPVKNIVSLVGQAAELATGKDLKVAQIAEYVPDKIEVKRLKAVVRISLRVVDVKTGEIKFLCTEMQQAEGESDINLEGGLLGGLKIRGGVTSFQNTITGKATQLALQNLTNYVIDYFNGKISEKTFTGNIIEIKDLNNSIKTPKAAKKQKQIIDIVEKEDGLMAEINSGSEEHVKLKNLYKVYTPEMDPSLMKNNRVHGRYMEVGSVKVQQVGILKSNGQLNLYNNVEKEDILKNNYLKKSHFKPVYGRIKYEYTLVEEAPRVSLGFVWLPGNKGEKSRFYLEPNAGILIGWTGNIFHGSLNSGLLLFRNLDKPSWLSMGLHLSTRERIYEEGPDYSDNDGLGIFVDVNYRLINLSLTVSRGSWANYDEDTPNLLLQSGHEVLGALGVGLTF